jgi:hypothetical protein
MCLPNNPARRHRALLITASQQRLARRYEDARAGRLKPSPAASGGGADAETQLATDLARTEERRARLAAALADAAAQAPHLAEEVDRVLAHQAAAEAAVQACAGAGGAGRPSE